MRRLAGRGGWAGLALTALLWLAAAPPATAQALAAQASAAPHATRGLQQLMDLEQRMAALVRRHDAAALAELGGLLGEDFDLLPAGDADQPIVREDFLANLAKPSAARQADWVFSDTDLREHAGVSVLSFVMTPAHRTAGLGPVLVVDGWVRQGEAWRLAWRRAAPLGGNLRAVPGYAPQAKVRKQV